MGRVALVAHSLLVGGLVVTGTAQAQQFESLGTRALGMGGAFVAVADDATAGYWNPAGIATGPTFNALFDWTAGEAGEPGDRAVGVSSLASEGSAQIIALSLPSVGVSYYRIRSAAIRPGSGAGAPTGTIIDSLVTQQIGGTFVHTLISDLVVGTTIRVAHGVVSSGSVPGGRVRDVLEAAGNFEGRGTTQFDLDVGAMYAFPGGRIGLSIRNLTEAEFAGMQPTDPTVTLQRLARVGAAWTPGRHGAAPPTTTTVAVDVDLTEFHDPHGDQRNLAIGAEHWLAARRLGVRGGFRINTLEASERTGSFGASWTPGRGAYVDGQLTRGTQSADRNSALSLRITF